MLDLGFENLGFINIAVLYFSFCITSVFASKINSIFGRNKTITISAFMYSLWIGLFLVPAYRYEDDLEDTGIFSDESITAF